MGEKQRLYNLDLIRIIAMLMIVTLHFLGKNGFWDSFPISSLNYNIVWALVTVCNVGVNAFVLISGYFLVQSRFRFSKLLSLSLEVLFYSLFIYLGLVLAGKTALTGPDLLSSFFPIITGKYWFITMYVGMYVLFPFLNKMILALTKREHVSLISLAVLLFSIWPIFGGPNVQSYALNYGFSAAWFVVLYIIAAYFRRFYIPDYQPLKHAVRYVAAALVAVAVALGAVYFEQRGISLFAHLRGILNGYNSITVIIPSILFFMFMLNVKITGGIAAKLISFFAPLTLGVYLIHEERHLADLVWAKLTPLFHISQPTFLLYALACIFGIYLAASLIDRVRQQVFKFLGKNLFQDLSLKLQQYEVKITKKPVR